MHFAQPAWLILLVLIPILGTGAILTARIKRKQWDAFVAPRLRASLVKCGNPLPRWLALIFLLAACATLIIGLARPQGDAGNRTEKALGRNLLIALDLSRSMRVRDVIPDRLTQAKLVIYELIDAMPDERIGLIGFAGGSYLYAPLTVDHRAVRETVEQMDDTWPPVGGSDLSSAVSLAIETLTKTGQKNNALVIISDGEKHDGNLDSMIAKAKQSGVYILAIGVGTEDGDYVPNSDFPDKRMVDRNGKPVISRLQADVMRKLATETKGRFALAGTGMDIPSMVKSAIADLDAFEMEGREHSIRIEYYQWLVLPAMIFLLDAILAGTRWRKIFASILVGSVCLSPTRASADPVSDARNALQNKNYAQALQSYHHLAETTRIPSLKARFRLAEADATYHTGDFKNASSAYSMALLSDDPSVRSNASIGMGNSLFQLGWFDLANEPYPDESGKEPDLQQFDMLVKTLLASLKEKEIPDPDDAGEYKQIESIIIKWTDAVRHFDTALSIHPDDPAARNNRDMTIAYLKRLYELLEEDEKQTEQSIPDSQPGDGQSQQNKDDPDDKKSDGEGDDGPKPQGDKNNPKQNENKDPKDNSGDKKKKDNGTPKKDDPDKKNDKNGPKPDEKPEERARRILKENADLEKGPLTPGRREFKRPEKDW